MAASAAKVCSRSSGRKSRYPDRACIETPDRSTSESASYRWDPDGWAALFVVPKTTIRPLDAPGGEPAGTGPTPVGRLQSSRRGAAHGERVHGVEVLDRRHTGPAIG